MRVAVELGVAVGLGMGTTVAAGSDARSGSPSWPGMTNSWPTLKIEVTLIPLASAIDSGDTP